MNLDPITIILFLLFFVAPLVNNFLRRGQGGSQKGSGKGSQRSRGQPQTTQRPDPRAQEPRDADNTTADTSGSVGDEFSKRLEEARRRVQEAMSGEQERRPTQTSTPSTSQAGGSATKGNLFPRLDEEQKARSQQGQPQQGQGRKQGSGQPSGQERQRQARRPFEGLGREGASAQGRRSQQGMATQQGSADRTDLGDAPPLRVQRLRPRKSSRIDEPRGVLEFDRRSVLQGIIWREILDEPLSKRKRRKRRY